MNHDQFVNYSKELVARHTNEIAGETVVSPEEVYIVWSVKALQNSKLLLSTPVSDGMYYESTFNGSDGEIYFDAYKKQSNKCVTLA